MVLQANNKMQWSRGSRYAFARRFGKAARQVILVVVLVVVVLMAGYEFMIARPNYHAAIDTMKEIARDGAASNVTNEEIHERLNRTPSKVDDLEDRRIRLERFSFRRGLPFQSFNLYVWYHTVDRRVGSDEEASTNREYHYANFVAGAPPSSDELPLPLGDVQYDPTIDPEVVGVDAGGASPPPIATDDSDGDRSEDPEGEQGGPEDVDSGDDEQKDDDRSDN